MGFKGRSDISFYRTSQEQFIVLSCFFQSMVVTKNLDLYSASRYQPVIG